MLWLLTLPLAFFLLLGLAAALVIGLLWLSFVVLRAAVKLALFLLFLPVTLLAFLALLVIGGFTVAVSVALVPLVPFILVGLVIWAIARAKSPRPSSI